MHTAALQAPRYVARRIGEALFQVCPPHLTACENCGRAACSSAEWITCEHRLAVEDRLRSEATAEN